MPARREDTILKAQRTSLAIAAAVAMVGLGASQGFAAGQVHDLSVEQFRRQRLAPADDPRRRAGGDQAPLAGRVDLKIENVENTVQAQINSLNNIIRAKPDAILIDAGSDTALNPTIKKACDAGIVVVSFDQVVTEACAYALESDWDRIPAVLAEWMAKTLGGKGKVFVDRGLAGAPISAQLAGGLRERAEEVSRTSRSSATTTANTRSGRSRPASRACSPRIPQVDGILTQGYGTGAMKALQDAGRPIVPVTAFSYNGRGAACVADRRRQVHPRRQSGLARRRRRSSSPSTSSTATSRPTGTSSSTPTS